MLKIKRSAYKRIFLYIIIGLLFIFVILPFFSNVNSFSGYIELNEKSAADENSTLSISRIDTGEEITVNVDDTNFYKYNNPIDKEEIWGELEPGKKYWVSLGLNRIPYRFFESHNLSSLYVD